MIIPGVYLGGGREHRVGEGGGDKVLGQGELSYRLYVGFMGVFQVGVGSGVLSMVRLGKKQGPPWAYSGCTDYPGY